MPSATSDGFSVRAQKIELLALDVDGVLTDGRLYFHADGSETKTFHTQDGHRLKLLQQSGIKIALITGRESPMVTRRAVALGIEHIIQGRDDKLAALQELMNQLGLDFFQVAYCGDDLPDLAAIHLAGLGISVPNAPPYIQDAADWVTQTPGGFGAVREICDRLLEARGCWERVVETFLQGASLSDHPLSDHSSADEEG